MEPEGGRLNGEEKVLAKKNTFHLSHPCMQQTLIRPCKKESFFWNWQQESETLKQVRHENGKLTFIDFLALVRKMSQKFEGRRFGLM